MYATSAKLQAYRRPRPLFIFPFLVQLPSLLVVLSGVQEFTVVTETTESSLLVIFADVRCEVCYSDGADIGWRLDRTHDFGWGIGILLYEGGSVCEALVYSLCPFRGIYSGIAKQVLRREGIGGIFVVPVALLGGVVGALDRGTSVC